MCPGEMTERLHCANCRRPYPPQGMPYRCPTCGDLFDFVDWPVYDPARVEGDLPGVWRYRHAFGFVAEPAPVSLNEGATPLVWRQVMGRQVGFKLENQNPTGSFKDRGSALLVSALQGRGVEQAVTDSPGKAGLSLAAYAAQAGISATIYTPDGTPAASRKAILEYGAEVVRIMGPPSNAAQAVLRAADKGPVYAGHAYSPIVLPGYATIAYELYEELGGAPGTLVVPAGHGSLLLALGRGFRALLQSGLVEQMPRLVGVQPLACAPLWAVWQYGAAGLSWVAEGETLARELGVKHPARGDALLALMKDVQGVFLTVDEEQITPARDQLDDLGFSVEASAAVVWPALAELVADAPEPVVVVLTGSADKE